MSRDPAERIADILAAIERCQRYVVALGGDTDLVEMAEDAIERNLQIIGEAVNNLPEEVTAAHPLIGWPQIRGFRNILVHRYFGVDVEVVGEVVVTHLPPLADALRSQILDMDDDVEDDFDIEFEPLHIELQVPDLGDGTPPVNAGST
ncbi:HepT-like ribonuclease domain-containing protein [Propionibacteriaceae bacterium G1746]|uniref:HepT-like ribonuclease domain-containing protein n=1 Tax=Aestuariimicrobium sp. G57 TaxID=3418485 RepID=UPI003C2A845F